MLGFQGGSVVGVGGDLHSEGSAEHGGDCSDEESDGAGVPGHAVDADVDDGSHDDDEDEDDFVFGGDEGAGSFLDDGSDFNRVVTLEKLLSAVPSLGGALDFDVSQLLVVVDGPEEADDAREEHERHHESHE